MKQNKLPIDPNTRKPFRTLTEMRAWEVLKEFIDTGRRATPLSSKRRLKVA